MIKIRKPLIKFQFIVVFSIDLVVNAMLCIAGSGLSRAIALAMT